MDVAAFLAARAHGVAGGRGGDLREALRAPRFRVVQTAGHWANRGKGDREGHLYKKVLEAVREAWGERGAVVGRRAARGRGDTRRARRHEFGVRVVRDAHVEWRQRCGRVGRYFSAIFPRIRARI